MPYIMRPLARIRRIRDGVVVLCVINILYIDVPSKMTQLVNPKIGKIIDLLFLYKAAQRPRILKL